MTETLLDNNPRLDAIVQRLKSCDQLLDQIITLDRLNGDVKDHVSETIQRVSEINSSIKETQTRDEIFKQVVDSLSEVESLLRLPKTLQDFTDDLSQFDNAIDLIEHIDNLYKNHGHEVSIIEVIYKKAEKCRSYLVANLCAQLESMEDPNIDEVKAIVVCLSRCSSFSDRDLRVRYLQARDNWFDRKCREQSSSFDNVVKVHCEELPRIYEEYKALFSDLSYMSDVKSIWLSHEFTNQEDGAIINSWLLLRSTIFISSLESHLESLTSAGNTTPTMICDTMLKCFELTERLSSVGSDFSSQLKPLFSRAVVNEVIVSIEKSTIRFEASFTSAVTISVESLLLPVDDEILRVANMKPEEQLPKSIEHYPIFKIYCLYLIDSLRWLKTTKHILSPVNMCLDTYAALNASLTRVMKALAMALNSDNNTNHPILSRIAMSFFTEVLPFVADYCETIFPEKLILGALGLTKSEFKITAAKDPDKAKNIRLDLMQIAEPLRSTMPALMKTAEMDDIL